MEFYDNYRFTVDTTLTDLEKVFRSIYLAHPERHLDQPQELHYVRDILQEASAKSQHFFPQLLSETDSLEEELFFQGNLDAEFYRHLRYLPANWHMHSFLEVIYVAEGVCTNYIVEQRLEMKKGDICIVAPNTRHAISVFSDDTVIFNILFRTSTFETAFFGTLSENDVLSDFFMRTLYNSPKHPYLYFRTGDDKELRNYLGYSYEEFLGNRQYKNRMINSILNAFFIILLRNHGANVILPGGSPHGSDQNLIFILKYMQEHYASITLKDLALFFNYSERQLQRIIKSSTGMSFSENIQKLKMNQAAKLLSNPDLSVSQIAEELGYADAGNFRHIFKKYYGMTPMEYREKP